MSLYVNATLEMHFVRQQCEHRLPTRWIDISVCWNWHYPVIVKQVGSIGANNHLEDADIATRNIAQTEEMLRLAK